MNYFQLYELPEAPVVDKSLLNQKYRSLQRKFHPDFYSGETEDIQEGVLHKSAEVNKAYQVFSDADRTIAYFLHLNNFLEENEKYALPPDFLAEMMDINEAVMEDDNTAVEKLVEETSKSLMESIGTVLEKKSGFYKEDFELLKSYYYRKKYLKRILDRLGD